MSSDHSIVILAEHDEGGIRPTTWEGLTLAREIQLYLPGPIRICILGDLIRTAAEQLAAQAGEEVLAVRIPGLSFYHPEVVLQVLPELLSSRPPAYLILPHTSRGWDLAPRLARRLGWACLTGVTRVIREGDRFRFQKPLYGGKVNAQVESKTTRAVLTFEPGYFKRPGAHSGRPGWVNDITVPLPACRSQWLGTVPVPEGGAALRDAEVVVAAGRGIGKQENLDLIHRLAGQFGKSAVAGSRPLCDLGWLKGHQQVGLTGMTVTPRFYLACGISGAYQHLAGMKDSGFIAAINRDPRAAIFNWSDLCIVEDLETFLPLLIETLQKVQETKI